jgi:hypothetical protein
MKARMITRCGCERIINVPYPPPREFVLPLKPRVPNGGLVREWMRREPSEYDPARDGIQTRKFRVSLESLECLEKLGPDDCVVWYDEMCDCDPPGFCPDVRTYTQEPQPLDGSLY